VGAGAIGGFIAAMLSRAGNAVGVVARGAHLAAIRRDGLQIKSSAGDFTVSVAASDDLRELGVFDAVLIAVKAHQLGEIVPQLVLATQSRATIVPLQNGIPFWYFEDRSLESVDPSGRVRAAIPRELIVGAVIHTSGEILNPGVIHQSGDPDFIFGNPPGARSDGRLEEVVGLFDAAGLGVTAPPDLRPAVWRKLLGNVSLNPVSALTRRTIKPMLDDPPTGRLIARLMTETLRVAAAAGSPLEIRVDERIEVAARLADVKTSMLQDLEAGRPLELEPIVGAVIEVADLYGVSIPTIRTIYALTRSLQGAAA
ncbi:MAG: 2-dehydropantoate 2-reductase, partial [Candidatus Eremiobacteraeota bacterium]|nr:2-dehydropantoate 2-reductase [Candidatus Eremiobacteraeota bacterium]